MNNPTTGVKENVNSEHIRYLLYNFPCAEETFSCLLVYWSILLKM